MQHLSEVAHILRAALNQDAEKARGYAELLITKLHEDGEDRQANILHTVLYPSLEDDGKRIMPSVNDTCCDCCEKPCDWRDLVTGDGGESWVCPSCSRALTLGSQQ